VIRREQKRRAVLIGATAVAALQVDVIPTLAQTSEKAASGGRGAALSRRPKSDDTKQSVVAHRKHQSPSETCRRAAAESSLRIAIHEGPGGVVYRCDLTASNANRWLEIPAWMFDRSACAKVRLADEPHTDLSALVMLGALRRPLPAVEFFPAEIGTLAGRAGEDRADHQP
jgi:hypothetical protein